MRAGNRRHLLDQTLGQAEASLTKLVQYNWVMGRPLKLVADPLLGYQASAWACLSENGLFGDVTNLSRLCA